MISVSELERILEEKEPAMTRETYTIVLTRPAGVSGNYMKRYIAEAVERWAGVRGTFETPSEANNWTGDPLLGWRPEIVVRRRSILEKEDADG